MHEVNVPRHLQAQTMNIMYKIPTLQQGTLNLLSYNDNYTPLHFSLTV